MLLIKDIKYMQNEFHDAKMFHKRPPPIRDAQPLPPPGISIVVGAVVKDTTHHDDDKLAAATTATWSHLCSSSHMALAPVLAVAQVFAIMPLYGIRTSDAAQLRFVWLSGRMLHTMLVLVAFFVMSVLSIVWGAAGPTTIQRLEPIIWFLSKFIIMINFTLLARRWPRLMTCWESVEGRLPVYADAKRNWFCHRQIKRYTIWITFIIFVEHSMSIAAGVYRGSLCSHVSAIEGYFSVAFPQLYELLHWLRDDRPHTEEAKAQRPVETADVITLLVVELINYYCTILWTFMDIFIVAISMCLTLRFRQLNEHLERHRDRAMPPHFWAVQREHFSSLSKLIIKIDDSISVITTIALSNNMYFILIQLLHSFHPKETYVHSIYFWSSLVFLISRTLFVTLFAARLNDESKRPRHTLRAIPTVHFHLEAQRFLEEVCNTDVALTGMRFFHLNRTLILSMAGTLVTYELVLIQFQVLYVDVPKVQC